MFDGISTGMQPDVTQEHAEDENSASDESESGSSDDDEEEEMPEGLLEPGAIWSRLEAELIRISADLRRQGSEYGVIKKVCVRYRYRSEVFYCR